MLFPIKKSENVEKVEEIASIKIQVEDLRLQDKLGKQTFHEDMEREFEPVTKSTKDVSEEVTKIMTETSASNNKALEKINDKLLEIMNDSGIIASYLLSPLSKLTKPENTSQYKLVKDPSSNSVNNSLINKTTPVTLHSNLLTFPDTDEKFELQDLLKMITNETYNADLANLADKKLMYDFAKELYFDENPLENRSIWDKSFIGLFE